MEIVRILQIFGAILEARIFRSSHHGVPKVFGTCNTKNTKDLPTGIWALLKMMNPFRLQAKKYYGTQSYQNATNPKIRA